MKPSKNALYLSTILLTSSASVAMADSITEALINGKMSANLNLRYENVSQDNALKDADALTLRTRVTYITDSFKGFSSLVEFEDSRNVLGIDDYNSSHLIVNHLVEKGCKRIAHIGGYKRTRIFNNRIKGYIDALNKQVFFV
mgnify:CR=1 FL=1